MLDRFLRICLKRGQREQEREKAAEIAEALGYVITTDAGERPNVSAMLRAWMREAMLKLDAAGEIKLTAEERAGLFTEIRRGNPEFGRGE